MTSLSADVAQAFAPGGALAQADARYVEREVQQRMAQDVASAIDEQRASACASAPPGAKAWATSSLRLVMQVRAARAGLRAWKSGRAERDGAS